MFKVFNPSRNQTILFDVTTSEGRVQQFSIGPNESVIGITTLLDQMAMDWGTGKDKVIKQIFTQVSANNLVVTCNNEVLDSYRAYLSILAESAANSTQMTAVLVQRIPEPINGRLPVDIGSTTLTLSGPLSIQNEVEIKNDIGNPVLVSMTELPAEAATAAAQLEEIEVLNELKDKLPALNNGKLPVDVGDISVSLNGPVVSQINGTVDTTVTGIVKTQQQGAVRAIIDEPINANVTGTVNANVTGSVVAHIPDPVKAEIQGTVPTNVQNTVKVELTNPHVAIDGVAEVEVTNPVSIAGVVDTNVKNLVKTEVQGTVAVSLAAPVVASVTGMVDSNIVGTVQTEIQNNVKAEIQGIVPVSGNVGVTGSVDSTIVNEVHIKNATADTLNVSDAAFGLLGNNAPTLPGSSTGMFGLLRWLGDILKTLKTSLQLGGQDVSTGNPLPVLVSDGAGPLTIDGAVAATITNSNLNTTITNSPSVTVLNPSIATTAAQLPASLGPKTSAASISLAPATDAIFTTADRPIQGVIDMPDNNTAYPSGRGFEVDATTAGKVTVTYADGSTRTRSFALGLSRFPDAITKWTLPANSTFAGTVCGLK